MAGCLVALTVGLLSGCPAQQEAAPTPRSTETVQPGAEDVRYVSPTGRDDWPGTEHKPWRTLTRSLPALLPGQLLYVRGGQYPERVDKLTLHEGTSSRPIRVEAYPGEQPVVHGVVFLQGPSYWIFDGIDVTWDPELSPPSQHMVQITDGVGWTWRRSEIWGAQAAANVLIVGTQPGEPAYWSFTRNCVHDLDPPGNVRQASNLAVGGMDDAGPGRVSRNLVFDHDLSGRNIRLGAGRDGPDDVTLAYNTVWGATVALAMSGDSSGLTVQRNLFGWPTSGTLVRASGLSGPGNSIQENLGVHAEQFSRPHPGSLYLGPGNIVVDQVESPPPRSAPRTTPSAPQVIEGDESSCDGFQTTELATAYGRDAVG